MTQRERRKQQVSDLVEMVRHLLTEEQLATIEEDLAHGELLLPVELIDQFITQDDTPISETIYETITTLMNEMGSDRSTSYLKMLIDKNR
jgi:hypothetical protein